MKSKLSKRFLSAVIASACILGSVALPCTAASAEGITTEVSKTYNAAEYIKEQVDKHTSDLSPTWYPKTDVLWTMETAPAVSSEGGYINSETVWKTPEGLKMEGDPYPNDNVKYLKQYMFYTNSVYVNGKDSIKGGIMSDGQFAGITAGSAFIDSTTNEKVITSLTFTAPENGKITLSGTKFQWWLYHVKNIGGAAGASLGMDKKTEQAVVGFAIYKNNDKIWPTDGEYKSVTGAESGRTFDFPTLESIQVESGDRLRMVIIPLADGQRGYYELDPVVTYDGLPQIDTQFNAYQAVKLRQDATTYNSKAVFKDSNWSYETKGLAEDSYTGYNIPTVADWTQPELKYYLGSGNDNAVNSTFPSMFRAFANTASYGYGIATYDNKLVTTCIPSMGKTGGNVASTVTWTASQNGTVRLYDPDDGVIGRLSKSTGIIQALTDKDDKIGIAIYKNNKQIWPAADSEDGAVENIGGISYYTLLGETWDGVTLTDSGRVSVDFPKIDGLNVAVGDKIRIMIVPLKENFGYITLNPQIDYTALDDNKYADYPLSLDIDGADGGLKIFKVEEGSYDPAKEIEVYLNTGNGVRRRLTLNGSDKSLAFTMEKTESESGIKSYKVYYGYQDCSLNAGFKIKVIPNRWGDANMDGSIDSIDLTILCRYLLGITEKGTHIAVMNVNDDLTVDIRDLVRLKRYIAAPKETVIGPETVEALTPDNNAPAKTVTKIENGAILRLNGSGEYSPYLQYGVQIKTDTVGRTRSEKLEYYKKAAELGFKTAAVPVYWNSVEISEDSYNLYQVKQIIDFAEECGLNIEILWYGSNVCGHTNYAPSYIKNDTEKYPVISENGLFNYSNENLLKKESAALTAVMNYIYCYDKNNLVCAVQIENEPNYNRALSNQSSAAVSYMSALGESVKNGKYSVITRVNLCNYDSKNDNSDKALAESLVNSAGIDCVGGDVYTNSVSFSDNYIGAFDFADKINIVAEGSGAYSRYAQTVMNAFAKGRGYIAYELKTASDSKYDFGIYRKGGGEWTERDGTGTVIKPDGTENTYAEVKTQDIKVFNKMINALSEKIADMIYSKSGVMLTDEGEAGTIAAGEVNGKAVLYATATSQETPNCNKAGTVFYNSGDGYYYFFTTANKATFTINDGAYGENKAERYNEKTNEWETPENIHLDDGRLLVYSSYVYRIKIG